MKKTNPFDNVIKLMTSGKDKEDVDIDNEFFVNRILSYQPDTVLWSIELNKYIGRLPYWAIKKLFNIGVYKKSSKPWLRYPKKKGKLKDKLLRKKICKHFYVNEYHANQIIHLLENMDEKPEKYFGLKKGE